MKSEEPESQSLKGRQKNKPGGKKESRSSMSSGIVTKTSPQPYQREDEKDKRLRTHIRMLKRMGLDGDSPSSEETGEKHAEGPSAILAQPVECSAC